MEEYQNDLHPGSVHQHDISQHSNYSQMTTIFYIIVHMINLRSRKGYRRIEARPTRQCRNPQQHSNA